MSIGIIRGLVGTPQLKDMLLTKLDELSKGKDTCRSQELKLVDRQISAIDQKIMNLAKALEDGAAYEVVKGQLSACNCKNVW